MAAIRDGDAPRAGRAMSEHILRAARIRAEDPAVRPAGTEGS